MLNLWGASRVCLSGGSKAPQQPGTIALRKRALKMSARSGAVADHDPPPGFVDPADGGNWNYGRFELSDDCAVYAKMPKPPQ
jgi:hypothetical protein